MYEGYNQHAAVEIFRGRIRVSYDIGNYPVSTMFRYSSTIEATTTTHCNAANLLNLVKKSGKLVSKSVAVDLSQLGSG